MRVVNREMCVSWFNIPHPYIVSVAQCFDMLIWCTIGTKSFLFGTAQFSLWASGAVNYDYIVTNSLIGSRCIPNGVHTNYC